MFDNETVTISNLLRMLTPIDKVRSALIRCRKAWVSWCINSSVRPAMALAMLTPFADAAQRELADLSLEELANLHVTSVSKTAESLADAPASVYVITQHDVLSTGAMSLPEALRLAPNLRVARVDQANYAISARGFNSLFANKLLVLVDGRTVYSPLFSGVFWDAQDVILEDLDRIEVISGPGATLWGANAVNGVINVTSRTAAETQGTLLSVAGGADRKQAVARYGGKLAGGGHYRVFTKHTAMDPLAAPDRYAGNNGWDRTLAGFRADWSEKSTHTTLQGDAYTGQFDAEHGATEVAGANLLGRYQRTLADGSSLTVQSYFDHTRRDWPGMLEQRLNTLDIEAQHAVAVADRHKLVWGGGYRYASDEVLGAGLLAVESPDSDLNWANLFIQDKIQLRKNLEATLGYKAEHNPYTGWESLPNVRLAWRPKPDHLLWGAVSRAVRSPSQLERNVVLPAEPDVVDGVPQYSLRGNPDYQAEVAHVGEVGYRSQPLTNFSWSMTGFYAYYDQMRTLEERDGPGYEFRNTGEGGLYGLEAWASWQVNDSWSLQGGLVSQNADLDETGESPDLSSRTWLMTDDAEYYGVLRSTLSIQEDWQLEAIVRHTAERPTSGIPDYTTVDLSLGWQPLADLKLSLVAQNILDEEHVEFQSIDTRHEFSRAVYWKVLWGL